MFFVEHTILSKCRWEEAASPEGKRSLIYPFSYPFYLPILIQLHLSPGVVDICSQCAQ